MCKVKLKATKRLIMKKLVIPVALVSTMVLSGCSSMNPFNDSRLVKVDRYDQEDAFRIPKYMSDSQPDNIGVGAGRSDDYNTAVEMAKHQATVDLCRKLELETRSKTRTTATQNAKGGRSLTALTGTIVSETACKAVVRNPIEVEKDVFQKGYEFHAFMKIESDSVEAPLDNQFTNGDQSVANQLSVD